MTHLAERKIPNYILHELESVFDVNFSLYGKSVDFYEDLYVCGWDLPREFLVKKFKEVIVEELPEEKFYEVYSASGVIQKVSSTHQKSVLWLWSTRKVGIFKEKDIPDGRHG